MLTIDDGSFQSGNTFSDIFDFDEYHEVRLNEPWNSETDEDKKIAAIISSFDFFKIQKWKSDVFLLGCPDRIKEAHFVAANKELSSPGTLQADKDSSNIKRKRIEGAIDTEYFNSQDGSETIFTEINNLIQTYLISTQTRVSRRMVRR